MTLGGLVGVTFINYIFVKSIEDSDYYNLFIAGPKIGVFCSKNIASDFYCEINLLELVLKLLYLQLKAIL